MYSILKPLGAQDSREDIAIIEDTEGREYQDTGSASDILDAVELAECLDGLVVAEIQETERQVKRLVPVLDVLTQMRDEMMATLKEKGEVRNQLKDMGGTREVEDRINDIQREIDSNQAQLTRVCDLIDCVKKKPGTQLIIEFPGH